MANKALNEDAPISVFARKIRDVILDPVFKSLLLYLAVAFPKLPPKSDPVDEAYIGVDRDRVCLSLTPKSYRCALKGHGS